MPILVALEIGLQMLCAVHVVKTGRSYYWLMIILAVPLLGSLVYLAMELVPDLLNSRAGRQATADAARFIDPDRDYRALAERLETADTADNRRALAEECLRRGQASDAVKLYDSALVGPLADDPTLLHGLARAQLADFNPAAAARTLERLKAAHPDFESADAHLLYARALEGAGRREEALSEFAAVSAYFPGEEAKCRHALMLHKIGEVERARTTFAAVVRSVDKGNRHYRQAQRDWYEVAKRYLD